MISFMHEARFLAFSLSPLLHQLEDVQPCPQTLIPFLDLHHLSHPHCLSPLQPFHPFASLLRHPPLCVDAAAPYNLAVLLQGCDRIPQSAPALREKILGRQQVEAVLEGANLVLHRALVAAEADHHGREGAEAGFDTSQGRFLATLSKSERWQSVSGFCSLSLGEEGELLLTHCEDEVRAHLRCRRC